MSKIPQGEWTAIAARYQNGESISKIARSYGCTPPAIYYILKRNGQRPTTIPPAPTVYPMEGTGARLVRGNAAESVSTTSVVRQNVVADDAASSGMLRAKIAAPALTMPVNKFIKPSTDPGAVTPNSPGPAVSARFPSWPARDATPSAPVTQGVRDPGRTPHPQIPAGAVAHLGLDSELHLRAEAAIASFRSSFDAALAEGSAEVRARLRQAATDLMRVAARTTMVLDRINAAGERSIRNHNYPRSPRLRDEFETNGIK